MSTPTIRNRKAIGKTRATLTIMLLLLVTSLIAASFLGYLAGYKTAIKEISELQNQIQSLRQQLETLQSSINASQFSATSNANLSLSKIYEKVKNSVVMVRGIVRELGPFGYYYSQVQGSGFVYNFTGQIVIITNYHVVHNAVNITIAFANGNKYEARVLGSDPYADLAVLSTSAPKSEFRPLEIANSSSLKVGDLVITVGNPYGLAGSMSVGVISALGRTITEDITGGYPIANVIQTTAPINPGNSGGPLLNSMGQVIGITTAIVSGSQGVSFAIPSNTILREIESLVKEGSYNKHPWLGAIGLDMTYEIAKAMGVNVTYGWLIVQVIEDGPAYKAGLRGGTHRVYIAGEEVLIGGDIIIAINSKKVTGIDDLSSYLEEHAMPRQIVNLTIIRENKKMDVQVELGARPPP